MRIEDAATGSSRETQPRSTAFDSEVPQTALKDKGANVHGAERIGSGIFGSLLFIWGARGGGMTGKLAMASGLGLLGRAATGRCAVKRALQPSPYARLVAQEHDWPTAVVTSASVTIGRPREEVYTLWRDFANLARFMAHVEQIEVITPYRSRWTVKAPLGQTVQWTSHVLVDVPNERIAWESEAGADVPNLGRVEFRDAPGKRGTEVRAMIAYRPPYGSAGQAMNRLFRETPAHQMRDDLGRLKQIMETGEVSVSESRPQG